MQTFKPFMWRKGLILSATFLFALFIGVSCKKGNSNIGGETVNPDDLLVSSGIDTFSIVTYSISDDLDSLITSNPTYGILGSYNDPVFGPFESTIYAGLSLKAFGPNFYPNGVGVDQISIDSVVISMEYEGKYGDAGNQQLAVYRILQDGGISDESNYYTHSYLTTNTKSYIEAGHSNVYLDPDARTYIYDTVEVDPQLRIRIDTNFGWEIINRTISNPEDFQSQEAFAEFFKGFKITTENTMQSPGQGGLFYFNMDDTNSEIKIYYKLNGNPLEFPIVFKAAPRFNAVHIDRNMTDVETVIDDSTQGQDQYYAQAFGTRARIEIPGIDNIPDNAIVHSATLTLPVSYQSGYEYTPANDIAVTTLLESGGYSVYNFIGFDNTNKYYQIDMRPYIQAVINGEVENTGLAISPVLYISSGDRIVFNGSNTINKMKPRLNIIYTEF